MALAPIGMERLGFDRKPVARYLDGKKTHALSQRLQVEGLWPKVAAVSYIRPFCTTLLNLLLSYPLLYCICFIFLHQETGFLDEEANSNSIRSYTI